MINAHSIIHQRMESEIPIQKMEIAARNVDRSLAMDCSSPKLIDLLNINAQTGSTASGLVDQDYPSLSGFPGTLNSLSQVKNINNIPLPGEIVDHFSHVQCHCMMGLFPEINRAWLTVDSDIYIWTYEENTDLAYFDGINETILCVGLVKPKPGVFHAFIKYLLVLTTAVDIIVLGVTFTEANHGEAEIHLIPDPVFTLPTDGNTVTTIATTHSGRLFFGTKEGSLFEIAYQAHSGWFGKRCKIVNLSTSVLSFLVPSFLNAALSEEDSIVQIAIDNSRNILFTLTEKGSIEVCDLGVKGTGFSRITKVSQNTLVSQAMNTVKTLDSQNFRPVISISPVESYESGNLNLVAITQTGVRFYLSVVGLSNQQPNQRPYTLTLVHVRLPPGYSANVTVRPRSVHMAHYRDRNLVLISNVKDKDVLWCMSSDLFPFSSSLMEAYNTISLDGPALALAEVRHDNYLHLSSEFQEEPPLMVRQHFEAPKKYVVLTSHSVQIFVKQRPVDLLRQILKESHGQDTAALKSFFTMQKETQACATSLILASLESQENIPVAELATRAFFMFGGEPQVAPLNQTNIFSGTSIFSPNIISTPAPQHPSNAFSPHSSVVSTQQDGYSNLTYQPAGGIQTSFSQPIRQQTAIDLSNFVNYSAKHNGLYLYLGRILRPLWNKRCVERICTDGKNIMNTSSIAVEDCLQIQSNLNALHNFLKLNTQLSSAVTTTHQAALYSSPALNFTVANPTQQDAQLEEKQSLDALKTFVCHCCQIVGLWRILCDHQLHNLVGALPENQQQILQNTTFKELFLYRRDICNILINTLVDSYLGDNASVDSISNKLMEVCPHLYRPEDAAFSKANELLKTTRAVQNMDEKEVMLTSALQLCKNIAPNVNLPEICKQFVSLKAYKAVIELCSHCGRKIDPDKVAENYFNSNETTGDQDGTNMYQRRMEIYREIVGMLEAIYNEQDPVPIAKQVSDYADKKSIILDGMESTRLNWTIQQVIDEILAYDDELMHVALYDWMATKQMTSDLIKINKPSLEHYLKRCSLQNPENISIMDLMWKFYESNNNHAAAAKILNSLASQTGTSLTLRERLTYLARAIMCMRSDKSGYAPYLGVFLRDLEDKMEVARVQEQILEEISNLSGQVPNADEAVAALNSGLYEISQLYENFADPFNLLECQLAIIDCAGYTDDDNLIKSIWQQILADELRKSSGSGDDRMSQLMSKVKGLAKRYANSNNCFPLSYLVGELEMVNAKLKTSNKLAVPNCLKFADIPLEKVIQVYSHLLTISINLDFWQSEDNEFHLYKVITALVTSFIYDYDSYGANEKRKLKAMFQDTIATLLSNLYSKANSDMLVDDIRSIQARLSRL
ncbi:nuclear pore complex protein Nup154 [Dendroctonus ponderosae]|uniref:nuclear pore complex protein Nup154 n=1 Tax=Dendroctonus ponderosae TaxID=77166 RepID=UPI002034DF06|nr:nuclear pore complex protein Nup154 [Dendroctonus ponderosae]